MNDEGEAASVPKKAMVSESSAAADAILVPGAQDQGVWPPIDASLQAADLVPDCPVRWMT